MRIRTIKPDFFKDESIADFDDRIKILFIGLWCLADKKGVLEDRPRWIQAEVFPYNPKVNIEEMLTKLEKAGCIHRFVGEDSRPMVWITNFLKHQRPHPKEAESGLKGHDQAISCSCREKVGKHENLGWIESGVVRGKGREGKGREGKGMDHENLEITKEPESELQTEPKTPLLIELWNQKADPKLSRVIANSKDRQRHITARLTEHPDLSWWAGVIDRINKSSFLLGGNDRQWRVSFDWIIENPSNALKILEGRYDNAAKKTAPVNWQMVGLQ